MSPSRENPVNKIVSPKASENKRNHFNKTALKIHRSLHFSKIRCSPSTSTLPITSVPEKLCFKGSPMLAHSVQSRGSPEPRSDNRPKVVGRPSAVSKQNINSYKRPRSYHHSGCLRSGLGIMVWGKIISRPMVSGGNVSAYKPKGPYLALKIFSPSQINQLFHIQLQIDNQTAVSYINHLGEHTQNFFAN